jgi:hypothetical protein
MHMRRFTRLTNAFSKEVENQAYAVTYHNFVKLQSTRRITPAMATKRNGPALGDRRYRKAGRGSRARPEAVRLHKYGISQL